jgi:2'-5' RNA ligase
VSTEPASRSETLRLFVAIELPDDVKRGLGMAIESLRSALGSDALRWVRPEGMHVTLQFLGATPEHRVGKIVATLDAAARGVSAFLLSVGSVGSFGGRQRMRVIWLGLSGGKEPLQELAARLHDALAPLGFAADRAPFRAHLTLARVREDAPPAERQRLHDLLAQLPTPDVPAFRVGHISLMQSTLSKGGAIYRTIASFPLMTMTDD